MKIQDKITEVRMERDLFGRMVAVCMTGEKADIEQLLTYPLTPVPLSLCNLDGTLCKTNKSALTKCLKSTNDVPPVIPPDIAIIDGFFFLHTLKNIPKKYWRLSKHILQTLVKRDEAEIHIIFDQYFTPSIKDIERNERNVNSINRQHIITENLDVTNDFHKELRNPEFKQALVEFITVHWGTDEMLSVIGNKKIFLNYKECYVFQKK